MNSMGVYGQVKAAFQDIIAPELQAVRGDIRVLDQRIVGLDQKIDSLRHELVSEIRRLDARIDGVDRELRTAIDVRDRLAALEARRPG